MIRILQWIENCRLGFMGNDKHALRRGALFTCVIAISCAFVLTILPLQSHAENLEGAGEVVSIDRVQLVAQQIDLLKNRLKQAQDELNSLQKQDDQLSQLSIDKASKNALDKSSLDVSVAKSNLDSINIELADSQQTSNWLDKNIQEIENQLNVLSIFGLKITPNDAANMREYRADLRYQKKLSDLEKVRVKYLQDLQSVADNLLSLKKDKYDRINNLLKSRKLLHMKQQQVKDELAYQEQQNRWLEQVNVLYARLAKMDTKKSSTAYNALERDIFYSNENANFAYIQSLIARYNDQIEQIRFAILKTNSISVLNEIGNQVQTLTKQMSRLDTVLKTRSLVLDKHINYLSQKKKDNKELKDYLKKLIVLKDQYAASDQALVKLNTKLSDFRKSLDKALQSELSSRQGFPNFDHRTLLDMGKEMLLVPALTFQVTKSLSTFLIKTFKSTGILTWSLFIFVELSLLASAIFLYGLLSRLLARPSQWREQINTKWLSLQWLKRNFIDLALAGNIVLFMYFFAMPVQSFTFVFYMLLVWLIFKSILTISRICLVETTHDTTGHDVKLFRRLKWIVLICGVTTALTVFVHRLPLIYELKILCDNLFLMILLVVSLLLMRSWDVVPNLIDSHMESQHPYLRKSIRLISVLIPILLFGNAVIGLFGFVNLIMTVSWYEGIFLIVLIAYLILRGLLSDGMEQLSRLLIQYVNNGWLWTEAFLKPLDKVLRITLFLVAWAVLFLFYGWDKQSPIVARLTGLLHYKLANVLNTTITPMNIIELVVVISIFYWTAKWIREFVYRMLLSRTQDMGIRNSLAILSQYGVVLLGAFLCMRLLGIDLRALAVAFSVFALAIGWGLRDLANNYACGFLILLERPLRVGDLVSIGESEGEVTHIGSRAITVRTWDHMDLVVPNTEVFNKSFTNWTAKDNVIRSVVRIKISRYDNPHEVKMIIQNILVGHQDVLKDPMPEVYLREMNDALLEFELRYYVNIRQIKSRVSVTSSVLMTMWDAFEQHGIKPPYPQHEIFLRGELPELPFQGKPIGKVE